MNEVVKAKRKSTVRASPNVQHRPKGWQATSEGQHLVEYPRRLQARYGAGNSGKIVEVVQDVAHFNARGVVRHDDVEQLWECIIRKGIEVRICKNHRVHIRKRVIAFSTYRGNCQSTHGQSRVEAARWAVAPNMQCVPKGSIEARPPLHPSAGPKPCLSRVVLVRDRGVSATTR